MELPQADGVPLVADMSSSDPLQARGRDQVRTASILASRRMSHPLVWPLPSSGTICWATQPDNVPTMMNYTTLINKDSMYNTPPCWCIYMTGPGAQVPGETTVGGLANMQKHATRPRPKLLYDYLDGQDFYSNPVEQAVTAAR